MKTDHQNQSEYLSRDSIMKLLSDDEVTRVSTAETAPHLADGDEFLDLEKLDRGVQRASGATRPVGNLLPRKAVQATTWSKIVALLSANRASTSHARA